MLRAKCLRETWEETHRLVGRMRMLCTVKEESVVWVLEKSENFKVFRVGLVCESILTDLKTLQARGSD